MQSALITLLRRHSPEAARRLLLLATVAGLCGGGLAVIGLVAVQQQGQPTLTTLLLFAILLAALAASIGAIVPRAAELGSALMEDLRRQVIAPVLTARTAEDEVLLAFERLPPQILRGFSACVMTLVAGLAVAAAALYLLATRRPLGALVIAALALSLGLQIWRRRRDSAGSLLPHALARLGEARTRARFDPISTDAAEKDVLSAFAAVDHATLAQAGGSLRARLIELSLVCLLIGAGLYMAYSGHLQTNTLAATLAQLLMAAPALLLLSGRVHDLWAGEEASRAWTRLEAQLFPFIAASAPSEFKGLRLEGVRYGARERPLGPIDLSLDGGSLIVVQGESGVGKSALLRLLDGSIPPLDGRIILDGSPIGGDQATAFLRGHAVSLTGAPFPALLPLPPQDGRRDEATAMLTALRLDPRRFLTDDGLASADASSGEAARLALAAAMLDPRPLLLLDDPALDRDPRLRTAIARDWAPRLKARGKTIVVVTEASDMAAAADHTIRLEAGGTSAAMGTGRTTR